MRRKDILIQLSQRTKLNLKDCDLFLDAFIDLIKEKVSNNEEILIPKLGTFTSQLKKERETVYFKTGEKFKVSPKRTPKFKASKAFKDLVLKNDL